MCRGASEVLGILGEVPDSWAFPLQLQEFQVISILGSEVAVLKDSENLR